MRSGRRPPTTLAKTLFILHSFSSENAISTPTPDYSCGSVPIVLQLQNPSFMTYVMSTTVSVLSLQISVSPAEASLFAGESMKFTANVLGTPLSQGWTFSEKSPLIPGTEATFRFPAAGVFSPSFKATSGCRGASVLSTSPSAVTVRKKTLLVSFSYA
jgi:hypothetical protein